MMVVHEHGSLGEGENKNIVQMYGERMVCVCGIITKNFYRNPQIST